MRRPLSGCFKAPNFFSAARIGVAFDLASSPWQVVELYKELSDAVVVLAAQPTDGQADAEADNQTDRQADQEASADGR
jgi:hypothetical protein